MTWQKHLADGNSRWTLIGLALSHFSIRVLHSHCYLSVSLSVLDQSDLLSVSVIII